MADCTALCTFLDDKNIPYLRDEPMARHTTFRIGGPAPALVRPRDLSELRQVLRCCHENGLQPLFLGAGSNMLVADAGLSRPAIQLPGGEPRREGDRIIAPAGCTMPRLSRFAADEGLSGLEFACGIPGTVGGGVTMNAGATGGEMSDAATKVFCLGPGGEEIVLTRDEMDFGYRRSAMSAMPGVCVTSAEFGLTPGDSAAIRAQIDEYLRQRAAKQPLELPSAGSVFKRPEGAFAGTLIERCGLKGARVGGAEVSVKHAGFIVNRGGATAADVLALIRRIQDTVRRETGYDLQCEVRLVE